MLERLSIQNVALIERADLTFSAGLNVLSGETGAGKSVILDSIDFVLGAKADKSMIRYGEKECSVRAEFFIDDTVKAVLGEMDIEGDDVLVISRKFNSEGKGAVKINGCAVTSAMLKKVTSLLVDIHGQSEHFFLLKESNQLRLLDSIAGSEADTQKSILKERLGERKRILNELAALGGDEGERSRRLDVLHFQIEEIERAAIRAGEEEELLSKRNKIRYAEKLLDGLQTAIGLLSSDGGGLDALGSARRAIGALTKYEESYGALADRLENAVAEVADIAETAEEFAAQLDFDEREAERVENRLDEIKRLKKKYGGSVEALNDFYAKAKEELALLTDSGARREELEGQLVRTNGEIYQTCLALTQARRKAADGFTRRVTDEMKTLNIPSARFKVEMSPYTQEDVTRAGADGLDGVRFLFSANAGEPLKELGKIISGGEMSRFMLAVKAQLSAEHPIGTYLFDEIDAGIGGNTSRVIAEKFCSIARSTQIIAVSHSAQIAAYADRQFCIEKHEGERTLTTIAPVEGDARLKELTRLVGNESKYAEKHASELIKNAAAYKKSLS